MHPLIHLHNTDYHPFGMLMPNRSENGDQYRFGFNGQEKDDEVKGQGAQYDYGFRIYDPRIAKFLSVDPLTASYPFYTPYQFAGNKPIWAIDLDGLEEFIYQYLYKDGKATLIEIISNVEKEVWVENGYYGKYPTQKKIKIDKRTGEQMNPDEVGMAQYQYFDESGNPINIRRDLNGNYVEGENELMLDWTFNMDGSVYIGGNNPPMVDGEFDYRREPQDEADAIAEQHDKDFDPLKLTGLNGSLDPKSSPANNKAISSAQNLLYKEIDSVTGKKVTKKTKGRAKILLLFKLVEKIKSTEPTRSPIMGP